MNIKNALSNRSIGAYLALVFSIMTIVLTVILVQVIGIAATRQLKNNIGNGLAELALQTSDKLDRGMHERYREVRLMSMRKDLTSREVSVDDKRRVLDERQQTYGFYAWIGLTDPEGKVLASTQKMLEGANVAQRPWFRNALAGNHLGDVHEAVLLAKLLPNPTSEPKRFVDVAFPYRDSQGTLLGVLGVHLSWQWARDVERSIIDPIAVRRRVESMILDRAGTVLLGPPGMQGKTLDIKRYQLADGRPNAFHIEASDDGRQYLVGHSASRGYADYPGLGWTVVVRQDAEEAYAPAKRLQQQVLWSGIGLAVLFSVLGWLVARRIAQPLGELAASAQQVQTRQADGIARIDTDYLEVRRLSGSLNALVADLLQKESALRDLNQTLERRVEQRTQELAQALADVRNSEKRIKTIIETAQDAFIGVDLHGKVTDWNSRAEQMFGWNADEAIGRSLQELIIPQRFHDRYAAALADFHRTGALDYLNQRLERIVVNRAGHEFPVEATIGLAGTADTYFFSAFLHDISERKKVERMKSEFVSTVSHELRTPLTSIRASLSMLVDDMDGMGADLPPDVRGLLNISYQSCERLVRLVNDVLDVQQIESGNMAYQMRDQPLLPLIRESMDAMDSYARQYRVRLDLQTDGSEPQLPFDHDRMIQVLHNLLSNAIKFSPPESTVTLSMERRDRHVRISVSDHGSGIPQQFRDRIFQKFAQADATDSRRKGGTGLGLSICKSIVEEHGGEISFESEPGEGTAFHVDLPLKM
ncbi:ATP-binding protein [Noviherbaspirillum sp. CPCC 100848]|uniref:histidine kinase n=1 Tax=Noviherbaspirillum album TaxID=3080276 RepID=A0ABU6J7F3_9BURK|nr:ATP-binding protein [Noviherbaspirillum sp. CPCC 100848]MEC4719581.1 ATP-binding protein [Noviherbaspirillum sp. CPCC 100848]